MPPLRCTGESWPLDRPHAPKCWTHRVACAARGLCIVWQREQSRTSSHRPWRRPCPSADPRFPARRWQPFDRRAARSSSPVRGMSTSGARISYAPAPLPTAARVPIQTVRHTPVPWSARRICSFRGGVGVRATVPWPKRILPGWPQPLCRVDIRRWAAWWLH